LPKKNEIEERGVFVEEPIVDGNGELVGSRISAAGLAGPARVRRSASARQELGIQATSDLGNQSFD
jgi:hypothetical protein